MQSMYMSIESLKEVKPDTLRKSWRKLWSEVLTQSED